MGHWGASEQKNKQLTEPLKRAHADVEELETQLKAYEEDKKKLATVKDKIKQSETMLILANYS